MNINIRDSKFLNYNIRSCVIDDVEMFLVSDLLRQYNEINNTDKRFSDYLRNNDTKELLNAMNEEFNKGVLVHENSRELNFNNKNDKFDIPNVIQYITLQIHGGANKGYVICEELLIQCLMWVDKTFAIKVSIFLKNLRSINNDRFVEILNSNKEKDKQIELLQEQVDQLKSRYTPEEYNWHFCVAYNELTNIVITVITKDQYQPSDKNIKRLYDLICPNPLVLEQQLLDILSNDNRFTQEHKCSANLTDLLSNKEFRTIIDSKHLFWYFKSKCKKLRTNLEWKTGSNSKNCVQT